MAPAEEIEPRLLGLPGVEEGIRICGVGARASKDGLGCLFDLVAGNADPRCEVGKLDPLSDDREEPEEGASSACTALAVRATVAAMIRMCRIQSREASRQHFFKGQ